MNFQDLKSIENADFYLDRAFKEAKKKGEIAYQRTSGEREQRARTTEIEKLKTFRTVLVDKLDQIIKNFPSIDGLPEIYSELIRYTLDYDFLKKSLGAINWARNNILELSYDYERKLKKTKTLSDVQKTMKAFYGRASSVMKQVNKNLVYLEDARMMMRSYPSLKTDLFTVAITGFPNIGKSTLLSKLTPAKPKIQGYAFTTTGLNLGYAKYGIRKVQFVDTPGVLNRNKMNNIEHQAYLVLKYLANIIVYVIDLTEPYELKLQEKLFKTLKDYDKKIIVYLSKTDILPKTKVDAAKKKYKAVITLEELNKKIEKEMKNN